MHQISSVQIFKCQQAENVINNRTRVFNVRVVNHSAWLKTGERKLVHEFFERNTVLQTDRNRNGKAVHQRAERSALFVHINKYLGYGIKIPKDNWLIQRFITVGYYALIDYTAVNIKEDSYDTKYTWMDVAKIENLIMDHNLIVEKALETLRIQLAYLPIGKNLLPKKFTMPELQKLYETILNKPLDRRNFQRKILGFGILNKLNETRKGGAHKAPFLYTFNDKKYI